MPRLSATDHTRHKHVHIASLATTPSMSWSDEYIYTLHRQHFNGPAIKIVAKEHLPVAGRGPLQRVRRGEIKIILTKL
jgi:hypothetical protein